MGTNANEMTMISPLTGLFYGQTFLTKQMNVCRIRRQIPAI